MQTDIGDDTSRPPSCLYCFYTLEFYQKPDICGLEYGECGVYIMFWAVYVGRAPVEYILVVFDTLCTILRVSVEYSSKYIEVAARKSRTRIFQMSYLYVIYN